MDEKSGLGSQLESFREARRDIEASVLPLATSVDGRRFSFQASLHGLELQAGGYAVLDDGSSAPFHDALIHPAAGSDVREWQQRETGSHAQLTLGELAVAPGVPCVA